VSVPTSDLFALNSVTQNAVDAVTKARELQGEGNSEVAVLNTAMTGTTLGAGMNSSGAYRQIASMGNDKTGTRPADIWDTGRQKAIAGGRGISDVFNAPGGTMAMAGALGVNYAKYLSRQATGGSGGLSIMGDIGVGVKNQNPYGFSKRERDMEAKRKFMTTVINPIITYEYVAPTGEYSQGGGLKGRTSGFRMDYQNMKYGMNEGELDSGKGRASILPGTGGNTEELLSTTKAGRS
jgi:hypothetical protein